MVNGIWWRRTADSPISYGVSFPDFNSARHRSLPSVNTPATIPTVAPTSRPGLSGPDGHGPAGEDDDGQPDCLRQSEASIHRGDASDEPEGDDPQQQRDDISDTLIQPRTVHTQSLSAACIRVLTSSHG
jgi:hypothetical protein